LNRQERRGDLIHAAALLVFGSILTCLYWVVYFVQGSAIPGVRSSGLPAQSFEYAHAIFERSFPVPDGFMALTAGLSAFYLLGRHPRAVAFGLINGGASIFLGFIDVSFNLQNGLYTRVALTGDAAMQAELAINFLSIGLPIISIRRFYFHSLRVKAVERAVMKKFGVRYIDIVELAG